MIKVQRKYVPPRPIAFDSSDFALNVLNEQTLAHRLGNDRKCERSFVVLIRRFPLQREDEG